MATPYDVIWANLLPKFKSYEIPLMTTEEVKDCLHDYIIPAVSRFHICRKDLSNRNDELEQFDSDLSDMEIEILSNYVLLEYLDSTYIRVPSVLKVSLSSKDFNAFSNANQLEKMMEMHSTFLKENETLLSRYSWNQTRDDLKNGIKTSFAEHSYKSKI